MLSRSRGGVKYSFRGFKSDAIVAKLTMDYFVGACDRLCQNSKAKGVSENNFFRIGFSQKVCARCESVKKQRESITLSSGKSLIVSKRNQVTDHFGSLDPMKKMKLRQPNINEANAYQKGINEGSKLNLDQQLKNDSKDILSIAS